MKKYLFFLILFPIAFFGCKTKPAEVAKEMFVDSQWKFSTGDDMAWATPDFDDTAWNEVSVNEIWESQGYENYDGFAWYRKQVTLSEDWEKQVKEYGGIAIKYDNADDADEFYFNGYHIGTTGQMPPKYESKYDEKRTYVVLPEYIHFDKPNVIAVRVYDGGGGGGIVTSNVTLRTLTAADVINYTHTLPAEEWVFKEGEEQYLDLNLENVLDEKAKFNIILVLKTDKYASVDSINVPCELKAKENKSIHVPFQLPEPGFYRCELSLEKDGVRGDIRKFNIGFEPEKIISPVDSKSDFAEFWENTKAELKAVKPNFKKTLIKDRSTGAKNIYHVEMMSFGNVKIEGYYASPKEKGVYPAIIGYMGYGSEPYFPHTDGNPGYAEFVLSVRGQGIQKAGNSYNNDWIISGLDAKENYYYRGAFMDLLRGIDFLEAQPEVDGKRIVAEGGSQGGAFTLAACALDDRLVAGAPTVPFLSDYRDYFEIVPWPRSDFERFLSANPDYSWDQIYDLLTYFDIKNLAAWIKCPIIMGVGLQDEVCPPHTNFSGYNLINSPKEYKIYFDQGHGTGSSWYGFRTDFFNKMTNQ